MYVHDMTKYKMTPPPQTHWDGEIDGQLVPLGKENDLLTDRLISC